MPAPKRTRFQSPTHLGVDPSGDPQRADRRKGLSVPSSRCLLQTHLWHQTQDAESWARRTGKTSPPTNDRHSRWAQAVVLRRLLQMDALVEEPAAATAL